jgi:hypothetical protein
MRESSERGCSVHYWYRSDDCVNCAIKKSNDKLRKSNSLSLKEFGGCPKHSSYNSNCDLCGMSKLEGNVRFVSSPNNNKVDLKENKPVVTRNLFGREYTYPVEQKYNICKRCNARFKPHKVGLISKIGLSTLGVFAFGPLGVFLGGMGQSFENDRDLCDDCNHNAPE